MPQHWESVELTCLTRNHSPSFLEQCMTQQSRYGSRSHVMFNNCKSIQNTPLSKECRITYPGPSFLFAKINGKGQKDQHWQETELKKRKAASSFPNAALWGHRKKNHQFTTIVTVWTIEINLQSWRISSRSCEPDVSNKIINQYKRVSDRDQTHLSDIQASVNT